jgi:hypothetical protein
MRNLCGLALVAAALAWAGQAQGGGKEEGFVPLFDGKSLDGWHVMNKGKFSVKDGIIFLNKGGGWLRSDKEHKDFELRMEFRFVSKGADSGIFVRASKEGNNWPAKNYQVQTMDNDSIGAVFAAGLPGGKVKRDVAKVKAVRKKTGEWQSYVIRLQGGRIEVKLNGETVTTGDGLADRAGYIGLQGEGGQLEFKNIRIKELK